MVIKVGSARAQLTKRRNKRWIQMHTGPSAFVVKASSFKGSTRKMIETTVEKLKIIESKMLLVELAP